MPTLKVQTLLNCQFFILTSSKTIRFFLLSLSPLDISSSTIPRYDTKRWRNLSCLCPRPHERKVVVYTAVRGLLALEITNNRLYIIFQLVSFSNRFTQGGFIACSANELTYIDQKIPKEYAFLLRSNFVWWSVPGLLGD